MRDQKRASRHSWKSRHGGNKKLKLSSWLKKIKAITISEKNKKTLIKNLILAGITAFLAGSIFFLGAFAWLSKDLPDPNSLSMRDIPLSTKIYDRTGEHLLYEIAGEEKRTLVTLDEIPDYMVLATLAAEDRNFYEHKGIDFKGILRAIFIDLITMSKTQGASTITQQLVKNAILTNEKTFTRKFKELILALALERRYTKDEIMQLYLNEIPYGARNYGVQAAAESYFNKPASELDLAESATLAAIPQATTYYLNNPDKLRARRDWILDSMAELGYITQDEADKAKTEDTSLDLDAEDINAIHFVLWVKEQLEEQFTTKEVEQGGLTVITTIDYDMQLAAQEAVENNYEQRGETYGFNNSGLVALNPKTGEILAMVGSRDYNNDDIDGKVNIVMQPLQPGSSMKPIVYAAGFERGYTPNTILWDTNTIFSSSTGPYEPKNYDLKEHGPMTIRQAIQGSLNIPAVKMIYLMGVDKAIDFAEKLKYSTLSDRSRFGLSMVLGGAEVTPLDHAAAYAVFANDGKYHKPVSILKVEDEKGNVLLENKIEDGEQVIDANIAHMISNILSDDNARAPFFGAGGYLTLGSRPVAAKTGTTNNYKDAWTVGYTPSLVAAVWTGNTDGTAMNRGSGGSSVAAPVWNQFMRKALEGTPIETFPTPEIPTTGKPMLDGEIPSETFVIDKASGKLATNLTPDSYKEEKTCGQYHTILQYVNPADPLGNPPSEDERDPAYQNWETGVQNYLKNYNENLKEGETPLESCEIPTEEDDLHIPANKPKVKIKSPGNNDEVARSFNVEIKSVAKRGVARIEYQIDNITITTNKNKNGAKITLPSWVSAGKHQLTVIAYDDIDNSNSASINIKVKENSDENISGRITNPFNNQTIELKAGDTYTIVIENGKQQGILSVYSLDLWTGEKETINQIENISSVNTITWTPDKTGEYQIEASIKYKDDEIQLQPVQVMVKITSDSTDEESSQDTQNSLIEALTNSAPN